MTALALLAAALAGLLLTGPAGARRRLASVLPPPSPAADPSRARRPALLLTVVLAGAVWLVVGGLPGVVVAVVVGAAGHRLLQRVLTDDGSADRQRVLVDLPGALDLLAVCLAAGATLEAALMLVAQSTGGPVGSALLTVARSRAMGADPVEAWAALAELPGADAQVRTAVGLLARADSAGSRPATAIAELAAVQHDTAHADALDRARRVAVLSVLPLGLCFLPAFVLVGVVPLIGGLVSRLLG